MTKAITPEEQAKLTEQAMQRISAQVSAELGINIMPVNLGKNDTPADELDPIDREAQIEFTQLRLADLLRANGDRGESFVLTVESSGRIRTMGIEARFVASALRQIADLMDGTEPEARA